MSITARPFKPNKPKNIKGGPPQKKNPLLDKRALLALLLLLLLSGLAYSYWPNNRLKEVRAHQERWDSMPEEQKKTLTKEEKEQIWASYQLAYNKMSPEQKIQFEREKEARTNAKIREFLAMDPDQRRAELDKDINNEIERVKQFEEKLKQWIADGNDPAQFGRRAFMGGQGAQGQGAQGQGAQGQGAQGQGAQGQGAQGQGAQGGQGGQGGQGAPAPGANDQGGRRGPPSQQDIEQFTRQRLANGSPEGRALRYDYSIERQRRQVELGLQPTGGGRPPGGFGSGPPGGGRGPGGFGGPPGGFGGPPGGGGRP